MRRPDLASLTEIAGLIAERDLAALAALRAEDRALARRADDLSRRVTTPSGESIDPAVRVGAVERWDRWRENRLRMIQAERARLRAGLEVAAAAAKKSYGREIALREIAGRRTGGSGRRRD